MEDDYKCYRCKFYRRDTQTCQSRVGCVEDSDPADFEVGGTDIFEPSPESQKTRREHFRDLSDRDMAMYICRYVTNKCHFCAYHKHCPRGGSENCINGIQNWLQRRVGIYDD